MARWRPGAADRLQQAAIELFTEKGYEATTVAEIAARAGVTERTFFRHFADKREVLFGGQDQLWTTIASTIGEAPADATVLSLVARTLDAVGTALQDARGRELPRARNAVIAENPALQERELLKLATLARSVAEAVTERGVGELPARLAGNLVASVFATAFPRWIAPGETRDLVELQRETLDELVRLAAGR